MRHRAQRVHPVLGHVDVEGAEVDGHEDVQRLRHGREVVLVVGPQHPARGVGVARQREPVDGVEPVDRHHVGGGVEVVEVAVVVSRTKYSRPPSPQAIDIAGISSPILRGFWRLRPMSLLPLYPLVGWLSDE